MKTTHELREEKETRDRLIREGLVALFEEWDAYIGADNDGHDDAILVGNRIATLRRLTR